MDIIKDLHNIENDIINWRRELHKRAGINSTINRKIYKVRT